MTKLPEIASPSAVPQPDDSSPYPGRIPQILDGTPAEDSVLAGLRQRNVPIDREMYIWKAYGATPPEDWGAEHEASLPEEL